MWPVFGVQIAFSSKFWFDWSAIFGRQSLPKAKLIESKYEQKMNDLRKRRRAKKSGRTKWERETTNRTGEPVQTWKESEKRTEKWNQSEKTEKKDDGDDVEQRKV